MSAPTVYGIRIRKSSKEAWQRGAAFRRARGKWVKTQITWATRAAAEKRLGEYRAKGFVGHVFAIEPAVRYPTATHYSRNFTRDELDCNCGCVTPAAVERELTLLAADLEILRGELGGPLGVLGAYRCAAHNRAVNGAVNSQHLYGKAADLAVPNGGQSRYVNAATRVPAFRDGGVGVYPGGGVHVDRRGWRARWSSWVGSRG